jgi:16S rRNA pseudouridine516 synthase
LKKNYEKFENPVKKSPTTENTSMRLDRLLSHSSGLSRMQVKVRLHNDAVVVDGTPVRNSALMVRPQQHITLEGQDIEWPRDHYVMLHKPAGYVCSTEEEGHPLVSSLVDKTWAATLHSAGRLDADTTGLVLLTSDGQWSHALTSPRRACAKTYLVGLKHPLVSDIAERFAAGLLLNGENKATLPAELEVLDSHHARVKIQEGRYHQVKRMFAACSNRVESLHREAIGSLPLDDSLAPGQWRELTAAEVAEVLHGES